MGNSTAAMLHGSTPIMMPQAVSTVAISKLPECALSCVRSRCDINNTTCICSHDGYRSDMTGCMFQSCMLPDAMFSKNQTSTLCGEPVRNRVAEFKMVNFLTGSLVIFTVLTRLGFKRFFSSTRRLGAEDWTILVAAVTAVASSTTQVIFVTPNGLGRDIWTLDTAHLVLFGKYFYVMEILYVVLITLVKICLSLFYLSIFPGRGIRTLLWVTVGFHVVFGLAFILKTMLQCTPLDFNWTRYTGDPSVRGHCIDIHASGWANGVLGVAADLWLLALPLTQLQKLRLHWKKKVGAAIMFMTGGIVTVVSILRLESFTYFANSYNPTYDNWGVVFWSTVEVSVGLICCCLPTLRLIMVKLWPRVFETKSSRMRASATASSSSNGFRNTKISSNTTDYDELDDRGRHDHHNHHPLSRASWPLTRHMYLQRAAAETDVEFGTVKVPIRPLKRMPSGGEECFELMSSDDARRPVEVAARR